MYSFLNLKPVCCSMSSFDCCFLTCIQISQEAGKVVWYSHLFKNLLQFVVIYTVKGLGIINKAEGDVFLEFSCFFWWSNGCWQFDLRFLCLISGNSQFMYCWSLAWRILSITLLVQGWEQLCGSLNLLWHCLFRDWNENWHFPVLWPLLNFPNLLAYWVQHFHSIFFQDLK